MENKLVSVQQFQFNIEPSEVDWINDRVRTARWPKMGAEVRDWKLGANFEFLKQLQNYWATSYDWKAHETRLNAEPNFVALIQGRSLHYLHYRAKKPQSLPVVLLHGWPSSYFEYINVAKLLSADRDIVVVSLPGFGFSEPASKPLGPRAIATAVDELLRGSLGYDRYLVHGGDWGALIATRLGFEHSKACAGIHISMVSPRIVGPLASDPPEQQWLTEFRQRFDDGGLYFRLQTSQPLTIGFALEDSPIGLAAWFVEKFQAWLDLPGDRGSGELLKVISLDDLLTNIMIYLVSNSAGSAHWIYRGFADENPVSIPNGQRIEVPVGIAAMKDPAFPVPPRSLVEKVYNVRHWTEFERGGHFPGFEVPRELAKDIQVFASAIN